MKILRYVCMTAVILSAASCQKELLKYDTGSTPNVYFSFATEENLGIISDSSYVTVLVNNEKVEEVPYEIRVDIMGQPVSHARTFKVEPVLLDTIWVWDGVSMDGDKKKLEIVNLVTATQGEDYVIGDCVIPADSIWGVAKLTLKRSAKLDAAGQKGLRAVFKLVPNDNFGTNYERVMAPEIYSAQSGLDNKNTAEYFRVSPLTFKVTMSNESERSDLWNPQVNNYASRMVLFFGPEPNAEKMSIFMEYSGLSYRDWYPDIEWVREKGPASAGAPAGMVFPDAQCWMFYTYAYMATYQNGYWVARAINKGLAAYKAANGGKGRTYINNEGNEEEVVLGTDGRNYL